MNIQKQLFTCSKIYLGPIDHENDPAIVSQWSHDLEYLQLLSTKPVYPVSVGGAARKLESIEKEIEGSKCFYYFTIRHREDSRLIGFASIGWIEWNHGTGWVQLGIGDRQDRRRGYGTEALQLLIEYCFDELNLYRLGAEIIEYNLGAKRLFEKAGFVEEVCRRKAFERGGNWWDVLLYGLLQEEWEQRKR